MASGGVDVYRVHKRCHAPQAHPQKIGANRSVVCAPVTFKKVTASDT